MNPSGSPELTGGEGSSAGGGGGSAEGNIAEAIGFVRWYNWLGGRG
jgi:hypothetical protein